MHVSYGTFGRRTRDRLARATGLLVLGLASAAAAQVPASYPKSRALPDVAAWIISNTPLQLSQVVDVGPSAVTAVTSASPTGDPRGFLANIAAEALDPAIGRQESILSWTIPVEIDCDKRLVRLGEMTGYSARDLKSAPRVVRPADTDWVAPSPTAPLGAVAHAMCERDFKRPFTNTTRVASRPADAPRALRESSPPGAPPPVVGPPAARTPAPAAAKPPRAIAHGASPYAVQLGASPSQADAKDLLAHVRKTFSADLAGFKIDIAAATVDGKTVYRALVSGFGGQADATALCARLKAGGHACFVRR